MQHEQTQNEPGVVGILECVLDLRDRMKFMGALLRRGGIQRRRPAVAGRGFSGCGAGVFGISE
jgi:hypothetical protein